MQLYNGCVIILKDPLDEKFELDNDDHVSTPLRKHAGSMIMCDDVHQEDGWTHPVTGECIPWKYVRQFIQIHFFCFKLFLFHLH